MQFPCTTSEKELDYCLHRLNKQVAPRVAEQLESYEIRKFQANHQNVWNWLASNLPATQKANFDSCATKIAKKCHKIFPRETYVTLFREFVSITLSNIEHCHTVKPPNSRRLRVCANLSAIRRCSLLGGFVEIFKFWTVSSYAGIFWRHG